MFRRIALGFASTVVFASGADLAPTLYRPLEGAPYAASATVSPYATKVFLSGQDAAQPAQALTALEGTLTGLGLDRSHLVNVRASLAVPAGGAVDMAPWNAAWGEFFAATPHRPTRTTVAASGLRDGAAALHAEGVAAYLPLADTPSLGRPSLNPFIRTAGDGLYGASAAALVAPGSALLFSAGSLADPADLTQPENSVARFGSMAVQTASVFRKLERTLASQGFTWEDVFYVRALLSPVPGESAVDFDGFGEVFRSRFPGRHPSLRPALALWAGPGFNANGTLIEIEVYAAASNGTGPFATFATTPIGNPWLSMTGTPEARIASSGTAARYRALTWFSGAISTGTGGMHDEGVTALLALRSRLAAAGADFSDVVQLRAYPVVGDNLRGQLALWNEAYGRFFDHPKLNAHKPARTAFPISALPRGVAIEIELITVER
jgi:enamine deaminase RidA (YjgF/YER057c/UK114 family)